MGRRPCCDKEKVKKGPWSEEEDKMLKAYIEMYGTGGSWIALPQKIGLKRCGKSCRLRWLNYLRPNIKHGPFSEEEDNIICSLYMTIGSRWSIIAAQLHGRTDNDIKNYWNSRLKKKLLGRYKEFNSLPAINQEGEVVNEMNGDGKSSPSLNLLALERIQLHQQLQSLQTSPLFYNPSVWLSSYSIGEAVLQSQYNDCNPNMVLVSATQIESSHNSTIFNQNRGPDDPLNRFMAPSSAITYETTMKGNYANQSNPSFSMEPGLDSELNDIILGRTNISSGQEDQQNNIHLIEESIRTMWGDHNFDSESSLLSWDSSSTLQKNGMTHEYVIGFNP